jgi:hypothetical protein
MLGRAGVLTGLLAVIAVACSSDLVELLPLTGGTSAGGAGSSAGQDTITSGAGTGGSNAAGMTTQAGFAGAPHAGGGNGGNGGSGGGACFGFGCAGESGFSGSFGGPYCGNGNSCTPCGSNTNCFSENEFCLNNVCVQCATAGPSQCRQGFNCDLVVGRCAPACDDTSDCNDGGVCDSNQGTCVWCIENHDCTEDGVPAGDVCYLHRCVDCTQDTDCRSRGRRCSGFRCVWCLTDNDCKDPDRNHCNVPRGDCE